MNKFQSFSYILLLTCIWFKTGCSKQLINPLSETHFCYNDEEECGPIHWAELDPSWTQCGDGRSQSPIKIVQDFTGQPGVIKFSDGYKNPQEVSIKNNGHTLDIEILDKTLYIEGNGLTGKYKFDRCHFHWGANDNEGSEHQLADQIYPLELHMIHYSEKYASLTEAIASEKPDALTVLAIFFKEDELAGHHAELQKIVQKMIDSSPYMPGESTPLGEPLKFTELVPNFDFFEDTVDGTYFQYIGSLTTPPCSEVVIWNVFKDPIIVTSSQVSEFRNLKDSEGISMLSNHRQPQIQGKRTVEKYEH